MKRILNISSNKKIQTKTMEFHLPINLEKNFKS